MSGFFESDLPSETNNFQRVEIDLLIEFMQELKVEFNQNNWSVEEGIYYILAAGLTALQNARQPREISTNESGIIEQLQSEKIRMYGRYSVMKHQVAHLSQEVKSLEVQLAATKSLWEAFRRQSLADERGE
jgi:hypothetical protein